MNDPAPTPDGDVGLRTLLADLPHAAGATDAGRGYVGWAPGDDSLRRQHTFPTWKQFATGFADLDPDLNLVADFYFAIEHDGADCADCEASGYNAATAAIESAYHREPQPDLSEADVRMLVANERLRAQDFAGQAPSAILVNTARRMTLAERRTAGWSWWGLDSLDDLLVVEDRAKSAGVFGMCSTCHGKQSVRTGPDRLVLNIWMLYPRKGASVGIRIADVKPDELEAVKTYLRASLERHRAHFAWAAD